METITKFLDTACHGTLFVLLILIVLRLPEEQVWSRVMKVTTAFISLFLFFTCWNYGKTETYKVMHVLWEITLCANFLIVLLTVYKNKKLKNEKVNLPQAISSNGRKAKI